MPRWHHPRASEDRATRSDYFLYDCVTFVPVTPPCMKFNSILPLNSWGAICRANSDNFVIHAGGRGLGSTIALSDISIHGLPWLASSKLPFEYNDSSFGLSPQTAFLLAGRAGIVNFNGNVLHFSPTTCTPGGVSSIVARRSKGTIPGSAVAWSTHTHTNHHGLSP